MATRKSGLGRNLNVFLSNTKSLKEEDKPTDLKQISTALLQPGQYQPRKDMTQQALIELADSIKQQGIIQPIVARKLAGDKFEIIAGERRWRASKLAGLKQVPVIVHEVDDKTSLAMALVENIQREDLNPIEEARALARLIAEFDLTHQQAAEIVAKSRASVSNLLRLMTLVTDVQLMLERGDIEMGHARALLAVDKTNQTLLARQVVDKHLTVRETEALVRRTLATDLVETVEVSKADLLKQKKHATQQQKQLALSINRKVKIKPSAKGTFKVEIVCDDVENLEQLISSFSTNA